MRRVLTRTAVALSHLVATAPGPSKNRRYSSAFDRVVVAAGARGGLARAAARHHSRL